MPFDLDAYVAQYFPDAKRSGDERIVTCFFCGKRGKLYINVAKGAFYCFRCGAGAGASLHSFVRDHLGVPAGEATRILRSGRYVGRKPLSYVPFYEKAQETRGTVLPREYIPLYPIGDDDGCFAARAVSYLRRRGLTDADILYYRIGYCIEGRYQQRIVIPIVQNNDVVYFMARLFFGIGKRYLNPRADEVKENPANLLFNWDAARHAQTLKLTEGVFDGMTFMDSGSSMFGKQLHPGQWRLLHGGEFEEIEVWLDPDAETAGRELTRQLRAAFDVPVRFCLLAWGDPAKMRVEEIPVEKDDVDSLSTYLIHRFNGGAYDLGPTPGRNETHRSRDRMALPPSRLGHLHMRDR